MNELVIFTKKGDWIYYSTHKKIAREAYMDFCKTCEDCGINMDNVKIDYYELREIE